MEDTTSILPGVKRSSVNSYGIGALAGSSLSGVSRSMKDKVTKPTGMAQGRVAHMIEWQSWGKPSGGPPGGAARTTLQTRLENEAYSDLSDGEKEARFAAGIMQQFAISQATLFGWNSVDGDSLGAESNGGSTAHFSEVNQDSITSREPGLHHSSADVWPHTYVSQGLYCLSSSNQPSGVASPAAGSFIMAPGSSGGGVTPGEGFDGYFNQNQLHHQYQLQQYHNQQLLQYQQQATPNSTIHSLGLPTHPRLADLWGGAQLDAHQVEIVGHLSAQIADSLLGGIVGVQTVEEVTLTLDPVAVRLSPATPTQLNGTLDKMEKGVVVVAIN
ncbi:hypothetical protein NHX12_024318 [Muraenolepis orangiensis]|uniref:Uncharacterized protein n=1 Tax=Muraenolepis orangiensis TaxID=630683 RepID=A0A9Q0ITR4_9TELE|nr:hypothetical protein NHX12_024318 [Muraenolepis orangiensis]